MLSVQNMGSLRKREAKDQHDGRRKKTKARVHGPTPVPAGCEYDSDMQFSRYDWQGQWNVFDEGRNMSISRSV